MPASWRLARDNLAGRRLRTALLVGAIALSSSLIAAVSCAIQSAQSSLEDELKRILGASQARIIHQFNGRFDDSLLATVRSWPEVRLAAARLGAPLILVHPDLRKDPKTGEVLRTPVNGIGVDFEIEPSFRLTEIAEGRFPQTPQEILLDPLTAEKLKTRIGDRLRVQRFGDPIDFVVCGIYKREKLGALQRPEIQLQRPALAAANSFEGQLTSIAIILHEDEDVEAFCKRHAAELSEQLALEPAEFAKAGFDRRVLASKLGLVVGSMLAFLGASFIIVTGLTTGVTERQREMAIQRCIGASRAQLFAAQLWIGLLLGGAGALVGVPIGIGLAGLLTVLFSDVMPSGLSLSPLGLVLAGGGSIVAGLIGALYPAFMASRVSPLQAMVMQAHPATKRSLLLCMIAAAICITAQLLLMVPGDATQQFWTYATIGLPLLYIGYFILAVPLLQVVARVLAGPVAGALRLPRGMLERSIDSTPFRHGFTAGALMLGLSVLVSSWSSAASLMADWIDKIRFADGFAFRVTGISKHDQQAITALPFVSDACLISFFPVQIIGKQVFGVRGLAPPNVVCFGFDPDLFFRVNNIQWYQGDPKNGIERLKQGDAIIVADQFLTRGVGVGDRLRLGSQRKNQEFEIVGVIGAAGLDVAVQLFGIRSAYMENAMSAVFMDRAAVEKHFDNRDAHIIQVNLDPNMSDEEVTQRITDAAPGVTFRSGRWIKQTLDDIAVALLTVNSTVAFAALILSCLSVGNVIAANIQARRFEFGVLRAVGAHRSLLMRLILAEAGLLAICGGILGTLIGMHMAWVSATHYRDLAGLPLQLRVPWLPVAIGWLVLITMTLLAAAPAAIGLMRRRPTALLAAGRAG